MKEGRTGRTDGGKEGRKEGRKERKKAGRPCMQCRGDDGWVMVIGGNGGWGWWLVMVAMVVGDGG